MSEFDIVQEPATPMAAKRLTVQDRLYLTAQRKLKDALISEDKELQVQSLSILGHFEAALEASDNDLNREWVQALIEAEDAEPCDCPAIELELKVGNDTFNKLASNWGAVQVYPQGTLWRCATCGVQTFKAYPDVLSKHQEEMRITLPKVLEGADFVVLPDSK